MRALRVLAGHPWPAPRGITNSIIIEGVAGYGLLDAKLIYNEER
jgi:hypothetical protein